MRYLCLAHRLSYNIGDEIQSLAVVGCLPRVDGYVDRDHLNEYDGPEAAVVMNGWFSQRPSNWPPAPRLHPVFVGFHMTSDAARKYAASVDYLRQHAPIGCRDDKTTAMLRSWGVEATTTGCATLTLPRRERAPVNGRVIVVDAREIAIPHALRKRRAIVSHLIAPSISNVTKMAYARELLALYRDKASLVVTTRLHCALPCAAMGVPVVFFGRPSEGRVQILEKAGIPIHDRRKHLRGLSALRFMEKRVDWSPAPVDVSTLAEGIRAAISNGIAALPETRRAGTA